MTTHEDQLAQLRHDGWTVAVHNDYRLDGEAHTFWLLTHPSGRWVRGEGLTDVVALQHIESQLQANPIEDAHEGDLARARAQCLVELVCRMADDMGRDLKTRYLQTLNGILANTNREVLLLQLPTER